MLGSLVNGHKSLRACVRKSNKYVKCMYVHVYVCAVLTSYEQGSG